MDKLIQRDKNRHDSKIIIQKKEIRTSWHHLCKIEHKRKQQKH